MSVAEETLPLDHNKPPPRLAKLHELIDAFAEHPEKIETIDQAEAAVLFVKQITIAKAKAKDESAAAAKPHKDEAAAAEAPYLGPSGKLEEMKLMTLSRLLDFMKAHDLDQVESDYGPTGYLRGVEDFTFDRAILDIEALREHLDVVAIEKAIRAAAKAGVADIAGVQYLTSKTAVVR